MFILINLIGKKPKPKNASKITIDEPVLLISFSPTESKKATGKFNKTARTLLDLAPVTIKGEDVFKTVALFETDDNSQVGFFNSTSFKESFDKSEISSLGNFKFSRHEMEILYKLYDFKEGENWTFLLKQVKIDVLGKSTDAFILEKYQQMEDTKPRERQPGQLAQDAEIKTWFELEKKEGRKPSLEKFWDAKKV